MYFVKWTEVCKIQGVRDFPVNISGVYSTPPKNVWTLFWKTFPFHTQNSDFHRFFLIFPNFYITYFLHWTSSRCWPYVGPSSRSQWWKVYWIILRNVVVAVRNVRVSLYLWVTEIMIRKRFSEKWSYTFW